MKTLLISPQNNLEAIGLKTIHGMLGKEGHESRLLMIPDKIDNKTLAAIKRFSEGYNPDIIGISLMANEFERAKLLTENLKSDSKIIWGGIYPTSSPEESLRYADFICIGEGELTFLDIARGKDIRTVNNIAYMKDGRLVKNRLNPVITDLDAIPYPRILDKGYFTIENGRIANTCLGHYLRYNPFNGRVYNIMCSRGCYFSCTFCCNSTYLKLYKNQKIIRRRSPANIMKELTEALEINPHIEYIQIMDDCFITSSDKFLLEFSGLYKKMIRKPFMAKSIPSLLKEDTVKMLKDAGLTWINLGLQSGSDDICKNIYKRPSYRKQFLRAATIIQKNGLAAYYDVILDNPLEKENDQLETIDVLINTPKPYFLNLFSLCVFDNTEIKKMIDKHEDPRTKGFQAYAGSVLNDMTRLSAYLPANSMKRLIEHYKTKRESLLFRTELNLFKLACFIFFEPMTHIHTIYLSQKRSISGLLRVLPIFYYKIGLYLFPSKD